MIAALVAGLLAGYGIAIPVGAVATYLVALTARTSLKTAAFAALGVPTADGVYAFLAGATSFGCADHWSVCKRWHEIAEIDGAIAGAVSLGEAPRFVPPAGEPEIFLDAFVFDQRHAGQGIGRILLERAYAEAVERGIGGWTAGRAETSG